MAFKTKAKPAEDFIPKWGNAASVSENEVVPALEGKVSKLFDSKTVGTKGTLLQNGELETQFGTIKLVLFGHEIPKTMVGKSIIMTSTNKKFGSIEYSINEYDGKNGHVKEEQLKIGSGVDMEEAGESNFTPASQKEQPTKKAAHVDYDADAGDSFTDEVENSIAVHATIDSMVRRYYKELSYPEDTIRAYVASVYIELGKKGATNVRLTAPQSPQEPRGDLPAPKQGPTASEQDTTRWAEAIIPNGTMKGKKLVEAGKEGISKMEEYRKSKGFTTGFWAMVAQASIDLSWEGVGEPDKTDLPY